MDSQGAVDVILVTNSLTVAGGDSCTCPVALYGATPGAASPEGESGAFRAHRVRTSSAGYTLPVATLIGNSLDSLSSVTAVDASGESQPGVIHSRNANFASVSFASLPGAGPWDIVSKSTGGASDTLSNAIKTGLPSAATFEQVRAFDEAWYLPSTFVDPWAPQGSLLLLNGPDGLYAYDATDPTADPRLLLPQQCAFFSWSPDGQWALCRVQSPEEATAHLSSLVAVPLYDGTPITIIARANVGAFTWASMNAIYYWDKDTGAPRELSPPGQWQQSVLASTVSRTELFSLWDRPTSQRIVKRFVGDAVTPAVDTIAALNGGPLIAEFTQFPDDGPFLVFRANEGQIPHSVVMSSAGEELLDLTDAFHICATSVSPDGQYIVGYDEVDTDLDIASAQLYLADAHGEWSLPVERAVIAINPRFSHDGYFIAFTQPSNGVRVGTLNIVSE